MGLEAIKYEPGHLQILDQTLLPNTSLYIDIRNTKESWEAIKWLKVRGAPAIGIVGCLGLAVDLRNNEPLTTKLALKDYLYKELDYLVSARPTAVHMRQASNSLKQQTSKFYEDEKITVEKMKDKILEDLENMQEDDILMNKAIGINGALDITNRVSNKITVLTHCNTGALATGGYGTAIGVIRSIHHRNKLEHVYCTETRPFWQGSRLTAYELVHDKLPATLICDSTVALAMKTKGINVVVIGADVVSFNGDTANKIGSLQIALLAKHYNIPFYIACSASTVAEHLKTGSDIPIEERPIDEITDVCGHRIAAPGINCWNPVFDVTPASLITGIITEKGVYKPADVHKVISKNVFSRVS